MGSGKHAGSVMEWNVNVSVLQTADPLDRKGSAAGQFARGPSGRAADL